MSITGIEIDLTEENLFENFPNVPKLADIKDMRLYTDFGTNPTYEYWNFYSSHSCGHWFGKWYTIHIECQSKSCQPSEWTKAFCRVDRQTGESIDASFDKFSESTRRGFCGTVLECLQQLRRHGVKNYRISAVPYCWVFRQYRYMDIVPYCLVARGVFGQ